MSLLRVKDLRTHFFTRWGTVKAVDGVSFDLEKGETLGIVGESGCGKSITCLSLMRLVPQPAGRIVGGEILLEGEDLLKKSEREMRRIRGEKVSMILQDPMTSLNPVFTIGNQVKEAIKLHRPIKGRRLVERAVEMLRLVRISAPQERLRNWPHQLSGGMRQRVVTAISIASEPKLLIADEPTTALDATIQVQILRLLSTLQEETGLALIFVTHDLGIVARMCNRVAVMYAGKIVEMAHVRDLFNHTAHPYTQGLMRAIPHVDQKPLRLTSIEGEPPRLHQIPTGCAFAPRCPFVGDACRRDLPIPAVEIGDGHRVHCLKFAEG